MTHEQEYSNADCLLAEPTEEGTGTSISGWYRGPQSRCIQESATFGRGKYSYSRSTSKPACYKMKCVASLLHVVIDDKEIPCPKGAIIDLGGDHPGASKASMSASTGHRHMHVIWPPEAADCIS